MSHRSELSTAAMTTPSGRLVGLDVLRGFALYGVLLTNAFVSARPFEAALRPPSELGWDTVAWAIFDVLLVTKFVALFSLLFGIGLVLQYQKAVASGMPFSVIYQRRLGLLAIMGLLHGCLLFEGDILFLYSVVGSILYLFRDQSSRLLSTIAILFFAVGVTLSLAWATLNLDEWLDGLESAESTLQSSPFAGSVIQVLSRRPFEYLGWLVVSSLTSFNWRVVAFFFFGCGDHEAGVG